MNTPEKQIDIPDAKPAPTGYGSHHLVWDKQKQKWTLRVTVDMGSKIVGKRLCIRFRAPDLFIACVKRDAMLEAFKALGLVIRPRLQKNKKKETQQ
jgi:hypothetical protein